MTTKSGASASPNELCFWTARDTAARIRRREVSCREVMAAHLAQIRRVNPTVNAIVSPVSDDAALALADAADRQLASGQPVGPLHGLPIAHKDTDDAVGFPTTRGSPIFKDFRPETDSLNVERLRRAGAIAIGKTNVPEFALGSHTFNPVFGATRNPYDLTRSAGGSSGGAAVALATGMLPIADGSDMGGSLRNPGNFNNIVGFRPTPGLVSSYPAGMNWQTMGVKGPLARTVGDVGLLLSVMAGPDRRDPLTYPVDSAAFAKPLDRDFRGVRVAWCPDLGGLPLDPHVRATLQHQRSTLEALGCVVDDVAPDFAGADEVFLTLRAFGAAVGLGPLLRNHRDQIKPEAIWNVEQGLKLSALDYGQAMVKHADVYRRVQTFMDRYEFYCCAVNQVPPFPTETRYPTEIDGVAMETYIAWMKSAYWVTVTHSPTISVPAGFTPSGLPVGLQIVGRYRDDLGVLQFAHAFEQATGFGQRRPTIATSDR